MQAIPSDVQDFIGNKGFPCVAAKTALAGKQIDVCAAASLFSDADDERILDRIRAYVQACKAENSQFRSFIVTFPETGTLSEEAFEKGIWERLSALSDRDDAPWDPSVSSDPEAENFSYSLAGKAFYVVGLHPESSRKARRFAVPVLVFNLHEQFERLRNDGSYHTMRQIIRRRDMAFSGSTNPMLEDFGKRSEAIQYSGRETKGPWSCPFHARKSERHGESADNPA